MRTTLFLMPTLLASISLAFSQPRFAVPLRVTDSVETQTLYFGILSAASFCIASSDSLGGHAEEFLPPWPPPGVFDARFVWPRSGSNPACFDQGSRCDFRPFSSGTQRDTFRVKAQWGNGSRWLLSWPSGLSAYFTELYLKRDRGPVGHYDMLGTTSIDLTDYGDPLNVTIYSGGLVVTSVEQTSPMAFTLYQNYPNPFNPTTSIKFNVESSKWVKLCVFDVLGRAVATLVDERLAPGVYERTFDAEELPSGVYFYRLSSSRATINRKMLLVR